MIDIDRRTAALFALLAPFAAGSAWRADVEVSAQSTPDTGHDMDMKGHGPSNVHWMGNEQIAMLMYPGMTVLDLIGPQSMFGGLMGAKVLLVAKSLDPVTSDAGVTIIPTATFESCPPTLPCCSRRAAPTARWRRPWTPRRAPLWPTEGRGRNMSRASAPAR